MSDENLKRGRSHVHTVACYDDTWKTFQHFKHLHHLTADAMIRMLINSYDESEFDNKKFDIKQDLDNIKKKVNEL